MAAELRLDGSGRLLESVLDVGCGPHGLSIVAPEATFAGIDVMFGEPVAAHMVALCARPGPLPFADRAFDTVVCLDVVEHVAPGERAGFVAELARVAAHRVLVACPSTDGAWVERMLHDALRSAGAQPPQWLAEHDEHGLPTAAEIAGWANSVPGFRARSLSMPNGLLSGLIVLGDMLPGTAELAAREWRDNRERWRAVLDAARFGDSFRPAWALERRERGLAAIGAQALERQIWSAVRCPSCGGLGLGAEEAGQAVRCAACGCSIARGRDGAFDLGSPRAPGELEQAAQLAQDAEEVQAAELAGPAARVRRARRASAVEPGLLFAPRSWRRPIDWLAVLGTHIALAAPGDGPRLYIDGRGAGLDPLVVRSLVADACERLAGGGAFAPVVLLEGTVDEPPGATRVSDELELAQRLGAGAPGGSQDPRQEPARIVAHARWSKQIVDAAQAKLDRALLQAAAPPRFDAEPLVTVRIPTYGAVDELIGRAIPSALAGAWRNIEVLVCSDGPQPHARAAVEAIDDPRVRYIELDERPRYPSWPESFWRTAGTHAVNRLLDEARGSFIAPLDHDDGLTHDHIPALLAALERERADLVYGRTMAEWPSGDWRLHGSWPMVYGEVNHSAVLYSARLAHMRYDPDAWLLGEPGDWNLWRRMREAGAAICHLHEPVAVHFKERSSIGHAEEREPTDEELASDVLETCARELLRIPRRAPGG
ncbi:MAG TPA: glycosyltransferase [Solirubrobacteraceae bacterium]|nr:glycosyltransferase [Solirubrobacteraceae bacterium]